MAETKSIIIQGVSFEAPVPYAEGHTLTGPEARALNQVFHENIRNNFAKTVKASNEGAEGAVAADQLPQAFAAYVDSYSFATPGSGSTRETLDPVEKEARALAKAALTEALKAKGRSINPPKEASDEQKDAYKAQIADKIAEIAQRAEYVEQARKNVKAREKSLATLTEGLDL